MRAVISRSKLQDKKGQKRECFVLHEIKTFLCWITNLLFKKKIQTWCTDDAKSSDTQKKVSLNSALFPASLIPPVAFPVSLVPRTSLSVQSASWIGGCVPFALSWNLHINANVLKGIAFNARELALSRCFLQYRQLCALQSKHKLYRFLIKKPPCTKVGDISGVNKQRI